MTALDIITSARERLGDIKEQRWTENRLLDIVSQGQVDICLETGYLHRETVIPFVVNQTRFQLPSDCYSIKRVEHNGKLLPLHTRDDKDISKQALNSDFIAYKSNLNMDRLEIQPPIAELTVEVTYTEGESSDGVLAVEPLYGVVTSVSDNSMTLDTELGCVTSGETTPNLDTLSLGYGEIAGSNYDNRNVNFSNDVYGVVVEVVYDEGNVYGCVTGVQVNDVEQVVSGRYGGTTSVAYAEDTFHVFYVAIPNKLKFVTATLDLPVIWEDVLLRYVVGTALQDDNDANNIARGEAELQKYAVKLETIKDLSSKDYSSSASDKLETNYRTI